MIQQKLIVLIIRHYVQMEHALVVVGIIIPIVIVMIFVKEEIHFVVAHLRLLIAIIVL